MKFNRFVVFFFPLSHLWFFFSFFSMFSKWFVTTKKQCSIETWFFVWSHFHKQLRTPHCSLPKSKRSIKCERFYLLQCQCHYHNYQHQQWYDTFIKQRDWLVFRWAQLCNKDNLQRNDRVEPGREKLERLWCENNLITVITSLKRCANMARMNRQLHRCFYLNHKI